MLEYQYLCRGLFFCAHIWDEHLALIEGGIYGFTRILLGGAEINESQNYISLH